MSHAITQWFISTADKTSDTSKSKPKSTCVISTTAPSSNRKRKRSQTDWQEESEYELDDDDSGDDDDYEPTSKKKKKAKPKSKRTNSNKRRKITGGNNEKSKTKGKSKPKKSKAAPQRNNLLSFLTVTPNQKTQTHASDDEEKTDHCRSKGENTVDKNTKEVGENQHQNENGANKVASAENIDKDQGRPIEDEDVDTKNEDERRSDSEEEEEEDDEVQIIEELKTITTTTNDNTNDGDDGQSENIEPNHKESEHSEDQEHHDDELNLNQEQDTEDKTVGEEAFTVSRYGRKRKRTNYTLNAFWNIPIKKSKKSNNKRKKTSKHDDDDDGNDDFVPDSEEDEEHSEYDDDDDDVDDDDFECGDDSDDDDFVVGGGKKKKKKKKRTSKKNGKAKGSATKNGCKKKKSKSPALTVEQEKELADTFFMNHKEKKQYRRDKVMIQFADELAQRKSEDQRLFVGKKANPYFEIAKLRTQQTQQQQQQSLNKPNAINFKLEVAPFPSITSVQPSTHRTAADIACAYISSNRHASYGIALDEILDSCIADNDGNDGEDADDDEPMHDIEMQISDLSTATTAVDDDDECVNECHLTPRTTQLWPSASALTTYLNSPAFTNIVTSIHTHEFTDLAPSVIATELRICLLRSSERDTYANAQWCGKYRPLQLAQLLGNAHVGGEIRQWLKAWTNKEEKRSYLSHANPVDDAEEYLDSDEDYLPNGCGDDPQNPEAELLNTILLSGPLSCGKTSAIYAVAAELHYKVHRVNMTQIRHNKDLTDFIGEATQSHHVNHGEYQRSLVLIEEIDTIVECIPSIVKSIVYFIGHSRSPIILTAEYVPAALQSLGIAHFVFSYAPLPRLSLRVHAVLLAEGVCLTRHEIDALLTFFNRDLRFVLVNLQFWLSAPRTFDYFYNRSQSRIPLPRFPESDENNSEEGFQLQQQSVDEKSVLHPLSTYQRIIGYADIAFNSHGRRDDIFWSRFRRCAASKHANAKADDAQDDDVFYGFVQHILNNDFIDEIIANSFHFWFLPRIDLQSVAVPARERNAENALLWTTSLSNTNRNAFSYTFTRDPAVVAAENVIDTLLGRMFINDTAAADTTCTPTAEPQQEELQEDVDVSRAQNMQLNDPAVDTEWLQTWSLMIDSLCDNDILHEPHGNCGNTTYRYRLHPHTSTILDSPLDVTWERCSDVLPVASNSKNNTSDNVCSLFVKKKSDSNALLDKQQQTEFDPDVHQLYDTIQDEFLRFHMAPYLVTSAIRICKKWRRDNDDDDDDSCEPKLVDDTPMEDTHHRNMLVQYELARTLREYERDGNFDGPSTKAWFEYFHDFIATVCVNEYHRECKGGAQFKHGRALRRSRRNQSCFEHVLEEWCNPPERQQIVDKLKHLFNGLGIADTNSLPLL